jgi:hypothetical protein
MTDTDSRVYDMTAPGLEGLTVAASTDTPSCCVAAARAGAACGECMYEDDDEPLSDWDYEAIVSQDVNLADDSSIDEAAALRRRIAAAELSAMKSAQAEDFAQFTVETTKRRADRFEVALRALLVEHVLMPRVPESLENSVEGIADLIVDDIAAGTTLDDLDVAGHIEAWTEERS